MFKLLSFLHLSSIYNDWSRSRNTAATTYDVSSLYCAGGVRPRLPAGQRAGCWVPRQLSDPLARSATDSAHCCLSRRRPFLREGACGADTAASRDICLPSVCSNRRRPTLSLILSGVTGFATTIVTMVVASPAGRATPATPVNIYQAPCAALHCEFSSIVR